MRELVIGSHVDIVPGEPEFDQQLLTGAEAPNVFVPKMVSRNAVYTRANCRM
jgi:hypothetical protein